MKVATSYQGYNYDETKAYEKNGKLYVMAETPCDRCSGKGIVISHVENGILIPVQPDSGICYKCGGKKVIEKEIRLYTDEEFARMERSKESQKAKR